MTRRWVIEIVCASLTLSGCSALSRAAGRGGQGPLVVVLLDVSRSTGDPQVRARYLDAMRRVLDDVAVEHGTIVGDVIDDNPLAHSTFPIQATFEPCDALTDNRLTCDANTARLRQDVMDQARAILARAPTTAGTDIYDGVGLAERVFASYPEAPVRRLVICSDMVEHASAQPPPARLKGVDVYVVGAGITAHATLPADRILAMRRAWMRIFAEAGANLPAARYGAALVRFP